MNEYSKQIKLMAENIGEGTVETTSEDISLEYYKEDGTIGARSITIIYPSTCTFPIPVIFICHYGIDDNINSVIKYLKLGLAVVTLSNVTTKENSILMTDDLRFNNAVLEYLQENKKFDSDKIVLTGGSAGGYTSLMLSALHLEINSTIATSAIYNVYFTFESTYKEINKYCLQDFLKLKDNEKSNIASIISKIRFPLNFLVFPTFKTPNLNITEEFALIHSPIFYSGCFTNNMLLMHYTSDVLVPIENLTRKATPTNGETIDVDMSFKLNDYNLPDSLNKSFDEVINDYSFKVFDAAKKEGEIQHLDFDKDKLINIAIFDDGSTETYGGHFKNTKAGYIDIYEYLNFSLSNKKSVLTVQKLMLLIDRFYNKLDVLKSNENVDNIYGSIKKTRENIIIELTHFMTNNKNEFEKSKAMLNDEYSKKLSEMLKENL